MHIMKSAFLALILISISGLSEAQKDLKKSDFITIDGNIRRGQKDTIIAQIAPFSVIDWTKENVDFFNEGIHKFTIVPDSAGAFHFRSPQKYEKIQCIDLLLSSEPEVQLASFNIICPGDHINIKIVGDSNRTNFSFSGVGATKFNCRKEVDHAVRMFDDSVQQRKSSSASFYSVTNIERLYKANTIPIHRILAKYKSRIDPEVYTIMEAELTGWAHTTALDELFTLYLKSDSLQRHKVKKLFYQLVTNRKKYPDSIITFTVSYISFLQQIIEYKCIFSNKKGDYTISQLCFRIKKDYPAGELRDNLLLKTLLYGDYSRKLLQSLPGEYSLWRATEKSFASPYLKEYAQKKSYYKLKGNSLFNASFSDVNGRRINLSDFRGKVVVVDFWFTGCKWCMAYAHNLEQAIYPQFRKDTDVIFLSICCDANRTLWLKSLEGGMYSNKKNVNVYTEGLGFQHPFTKFYDINGGPFSMIIDREEKIFSFDPPKDDMKALRRLINEALEKKE